MYPFYLLMRYVPSSSPSAPRQPRWKRILRKSLWGAGILLVVGFFLGTILLAWVSRDLPNPDTLSTRDIPQSTGIYDRTGEHLLYEIHGDEKRTLIKIADLPAYVPKATVSIEDRKFYEHHGIYWQGLLRAVIVNTLKGQRISGTSTLTQQLVKNAILTNERSLTRKAKEFILSLQIERVYTKDQILQLYLNEIPYGSNIYGIESASQTYFGKRAKELTIDEAAFLAAIPQAPDLYSPYGTGLHGDNRDRLVARQQTILQYMQDQGYITAEQATSAKTVKTLAKVLPKTIGDISAPHFVMYVRSLLVDTYGQKQVEQGGLKVLTTLDWDKQTVAEREVVRGVEAQGKNYKFTNAALVSLDPKTGQILAMVGSKDFFDNKIDGQVNVTLRPRQPGSSFKPIVYGLAFMRGYLPQTLLWDVTTGFRGDSGTYTPNNYDLKERGPVSIRQALQGSLNIPAVKTMYLVGVGRALDFAERLGYTTFSNRSQFGLSLALGSGEVKPLEHAAAFATFANEGSYIPTSAILRIEDPNGVILKEWKQPTGERVIDVQAARTLSNVLSDTAARVYVFGARSSVLALSDRPVAAKTGTTNDFKDAWTVGYTPNLVAVVWVGNSNGDAMKSGADGSVIAAPIWQNYMKEAVKKLPIERFVAPETPQTTKLALLGQTFSQKLKIDQISGKLASEFTPPEFIEERTFLVPHSILYYVDKDDPTGPGPTNPTQDPQFESWEQAIQNWLPRSSFATSTAPTTYDDVHVPDAKPQISILSPVNGQTINSRTLAIRSTITSNHPVTRVEASIKSNLIATAASSPWDMTGTLPSFVEDGSTHTLTIIATDNVGNRGETSISFKFQEGAVVDPFVNTTPPQALPIPSFQIDGQRPLSWSTNQATALVLRLEEPGQYTRIVVSLIKRNGSITPLRTVLEPFTRSVHIPIENVPASGAYTVHVSAFRLDGTVDTAEAAVTIP